MRAHLYFMDVILRPGFTETQRPVAAGLFWDAFGDKLGRLLGPRPRALEFLTPVLDPKFCLTASAPDGTLLGLAGFKTSEGALVGGDWSDLKRVFGTVGAAWRAPLLSMVERKVEPDLLLMDGIAVAPEARGMGVGTQLLNGIVDLARTRNLRAVRLDVIDTNPRARALYERQGFEAKGTEDIFPFRWLFGFSNATRMERLI